MLEEYLAWSIGLEKTVYLDLRVQEERAIDWGVWYQRKPAFVSMAEFRVGCGWRHGCFWDVSGFKEATSVIFVSLCVE